MAEHGGRARHCIVCVSGRPLAGKSTAAELLHADRGWPLDEADDIGAQVLKEDATLAATLRLGRHRFAYSDAARVEFEAPEPYRARVEARALAAASPIILVGLRSAATVRWLDTRFPRQVCLLYVAVGLRTASLRFATATRRPANDYPVQLQAAIESDQEALRRLAHRVIPNHASLEALRARLCSFMGPDGRAHETSLELCSVCGELKPVHHRAGPDRTPLCRSCYEWQLNAEPCSLCQQRRPVHARDGEGRAVCGRCYQRTCNVRACAACGQLRPVYRRNLDREPICRLCHRHGAHLQHSRPAPSQRPTKGGGAGTSRR